MKVQTLSISFVMKLLLSIYLGIALFLGANAELVFERSPAPVTTMREALKIVSVQLADDGIVDRVWFVQSNNELVVWVVRVAAPNDLIFYFVVFDDGRIERINQQSLDNMMLALEKNYIDNSAWSEQLRCTIFLNSRIRVYCTSEDLEVSIIALQDVEGYLSELIANGSSLSCTYMMLINCIRMGKIYGKMDDFEARNRSYAEALYYGSKALVECSEFTEKTGSEQLAYLIQLAEFEDEYFIDNMLPL
jgi:hypothetical protein